MDDFIAFDSFFGSGNDSSSGGSGGNNENQGFGYMFILLAIFILLCFIGAEILLKIVIKDE